MKILKLAGMCKALKSKKKKKQEHLIFFLEKDLMELYGCYYFFFFRFIPPLLFSPPVSNFLSSFFGGVLNVPREEPLTVRLNIQHRWLYHQIR